MRQFGGCSIAVDPEVTGDRSLQNWGGGNTNIDAPKFLFVMYICACDIVI